MDTSTHEIRLANWKTIVEQCSSRTARQNAKLWLEINGISEKQYYYWLRIIRQLTAMQMKLLST